MSARGFCQKRASFMRRDAERISDIIEAAAQIALYAQDRTATDFAIDRLFQDAVIRQLTIVGEAATQLSPEFKLSHPEIPWQQIAGFRNRIVHDYFGFNLDTAWQVATASLPELAGVLKPILSSMFPDFPV
jgi:uncharacterized protein with HEPN domain